MKDQFVNYEIAIELKQLGFEEPCFGYYKNEKLKPSVNLNNKACARWVVLNQSSDLSDNDCVAPLCQQAFDWLRKKYKLHSILIPTLEMYWAFRITVAVMNVGDYVDVPPYELVSNNDYSTYEEARQACLEQLIEIVKENEKISTIH